MANVSAHKLKTCTSYLQIDPKQQWNNSGTKCKSRIWSSKKYKLDFLLSKTWAHFEQDCQIRLDIGLDMTPEIWWRVQKWDSVESVWLDIGSRSSDVIVILSHCTPWCSYTMMPYHLVMLVSSKFLRSLKDTSYGFTSLISYWKLKPKFL